MLSLESIVNLRRAAEIMNRSTLRGWNGLEVYHAKPGIQRVINAQKFIVS